MSPQASLDTNTTDKMLHAWHVHQKGASPNSEKLRLACTSAPFAKLGVAHR